MTRKKYKKVKQRDVYRQRQLGFWIGLTLVFIIAIIVFVLPSFHRGARDVPMIQVGINGEVSKPSIYTLPRGADLAMLVRKAGGVNLYANMHNVDLEQSLKRDSVYHIPTILCGDSPDMLTDAPLDFEQALKEAVAREMALAGIDPSAPIKPPLYEGNVITALYVGLPCTYILIKYYPDLQVVNLLQIPYTSVFVARYFRLMDAFFTLSEPEVITMLQARLNITIDYFVIQDRHSFIQMVDLIDGVRVMIDEAYAWDYGVRPGLGRLDGFHTWEFIRYMGPHTDRSSTLGQVAMELRHHRQMLTFYALHDAYSSLSHAERVIRMNKMSQTFDSNMSPGFILDLYRGVTSDVKVTYNVIPGYYTTENGRSVFIPDIPSFNQLRNQLTRQLTHE